MGILNSRLDEGDALLCHGTNPSAAMSILKSGFILSHAGKSTGTMFGYGIYLAECVSKSDEYALDDDGNTYPGLRALLVCRSFVGTPYVAQEAGDYVSQAKVAGCDCIVGDREAKVGTYREFVFFDERQVVPEFAVIYRRQYDQKSVPKLMRQNTSGSTGRNWQVRLDRGWANLTPDVSHDLTEAQRQGTSTVNLAIKGRMYQFDVVNLVQTHVQTNKVCQLRTPMRR